MPPVATSTMNGIPAPFGNGTMRDVAMNGVEHDASKPSTGIIYPPPDIRAIVDKTADFVARHGTQAEDRIREQGRHNPKFAFMNPLDPYHAYYRNMIQDIKEGKSTKKAVTKEIKMEDAQPAQKPIPKEPPPFQFIAEMPAISLQDLQIVKLTAQFVARNGRQFMTELAQREARNYQFDFLRPTHSLHAFFNKLVKQYTYVLMAPKELTEALKRNSEDKYHILDKVKERAEFVAWQEAEKQKQEDEAEKEREAYASIDWHDFIVVDTVEFTEADESTELPPPMSLIELQNMSLEQKRMSGMPDQLPAEAGEEDNEMDIEEVDMDEDEEETVEQVPTAEPEIKVPEVSSTMKIRNSYVPRVMAEKKKQEAMQICPRCGQAIPASELAEHVRIELLDPKWKEQRLAAEAKNKDSNLLQEGQDVAKILKNFSSYRSDIFRETDTDVAKKLEEDAKKAQERSKAVWDGHTASINLTQQRALHKGAEEVHAAQAYPAESQIGPQTPQMQAVQSAYPAYPQPPGYYGAPPPAPYGMPPAANYIPPPPPLNNTYTPPTGSPAPPKMARPADEAAFGASSAKKAKPEGDYIDEQTFLSNHQDPVNVSIATIPFADKPEWKLDGRTFIVENLPPTTLVSALKNKIAQQIGMPVGRQTLTVQAKGTVMKNGESLAYYNIGPGDIITLKLSVPERRPFGELNRQSVSDYNWVNSASGMYSSCVHTQVKKRRRRTNREELAILEKAFAEDHMPSYEKRAALAEQLDMTPRNVQIWFQNRRQMIRKMIQQRAETQSNAQRNSTEFVRYQGASAGHINITHPADPQTRVTGAKQINATLQISRQMSAPTSQGEKSIQANFNDQNTLRDQAELIEALDNSRKHLKQNDRARTHFFIYETLDNQNQDSTNHSPQEGEVHQHDTQHASKADAEPQLIHDTKASNKLGRSFSSPNILTRDVEGPTKRYSLLRFRQSKSFNDGHPDGRGNSSASNLGAYPAHLEALLAPDCPNHARHLTAEDALREKVLLMKQRKQKLQAIDDLRATYRLKSSKSSSSRSSSMPSQFVLTTSDRGDAIVAPRINGQVDTAMSFSAESTRSIDTLPETIYDNDDNGEDNDTEHEVTTCSEESDTSSQTSKEPYTPEKSANLEKPQNTFLQLLSNAASQCT
ncbi:hypothetical protein BZG36_01717 [Bifiguratus adelaidae]|uniref:Splicing factor 3A subunit 1 n=1 Tax=Bifiguratus adelaidae TaxID=1938954 RepID=A0A261Y4R6_9FUNG|nr:hypothetical protein BZG36_01717 [Bifiguratus adelaidae]